MSNSDFSVGNRNAISISKDPGGCSAKPVGSSSTEGADEEEQEDSSSSSSIVRTSNINEKECKQEIDVNENISDSSSNDNVVEKEAKYWFQLGIEMEQKGKLVEAIGFYKKAVQLVPDIEFQVYNSVKTKQCENDMMDDKTNNQKNCSDSEEDSEPESAADGSDLDLMIRFQCYYAKTSQVCFPKYNQSNTHISALPMEIILYILRWVVSSELDLRTLEMMSMVCRGLYLCARDNEIWRLACYKVWGLGCDEVIKYGSWREMFIKRPRLNFNGCYISKTTYIRNGENSFQDCFYRPWYQVVYFRYLRFFPDGTVLMLTTSEEPVHCIRMLNYRNMTSSSVLTGKYRLCEDSVSMVFKKSDNNPLTKYCSKYKGRRIRDAESMTKTFHLDLQTVTYKSKPNGQLIWKGYAVYNHQNSDCCNRFEVIRSKFPPFSFSRVKSWPVETFGPLM